MDPLLILCNKVHKNWRSLLYLIKINCSRYGNYTGDIPHGLKIFPSKYIALCPRFPLFSKYGDDDKARIANLQMNSWYVWIVLLLQ